MIKTSPNGTKYVQIPLSYLLGLFVIAISVFAINEAVAKSPEKSFGPNYTRTDWVYVENGKVYYFENDGKLYYKELKDAKIRYNY